MSAKGMKEAKKKALMELIKKMRCLESSAESKGSSKKEEEPEEMMAEEDSSEKEVPKFAVEEPEDSEQEERKAFFKNKQNDPKGKPKKVSKAIIMSVSATKLPKQFGKKKG